MVAFGIILSVFIINLSQSVRPMPKILEMVRAETTTIHKRAKIFQVVKSSFFVTISRAIDYPRRHKKTNDRIHAKNLTFCSSDTGNEMYLSYHTLHLLCRL